jgi:hypothetical protein
MNACFRHTFRFARTDPTYLIDGEELLLHTVGSGVPLPVDRFPLE